ncbi:MAG: hypothetical protein R3E73_13300 [Porticoccaceae bacterium]
MSGAETTYEIVFRGDVQLGETVTDVKQRVAALFKVDEERAEQLFSGRPVVLKKNLDAQKAAQYQQALEQAGAVVEIKAVAVVEDAVSEGGSQTDDQGGDELTLSPVGADVLAPDERREFTPAEIALEHLSVASPGADVLPDDDKSRLLNAT